ncbi:MAG: phosphoribosylanthranilate isomerase [Lachnospiraceae bacterium]|jgi:phosphoribosylanthranilate isomerase|nr:phosphoribosylanthranilate isomerase [Lachnospiraceae bacterium]
MMEKGRLGMEKKLEIKICGITRVQEAAYLNEACADYAGFVFWEKSRRNVNFNQAKEIGKYLKEEIKRVAVTVSPDIKLQKQVEDAGFDILQVHGTLNTKILEDSKIPIWQACNLREPEDMEKLTEHDKITGYVIDAGTPGGGRAFDWATCQTVVERMRKTVFAGKFLILAGGLNSGNVQKAVRLLDPDVVDVSSGVEGACGKEKERIMEFVDSLRKQRE